jgi:hypothetical protein
VPVVMGAGDEGHVEILAVSCRRAHCAWGGHFVTGIPVVAG